jgi:GTP-binding protein
MPIPVVSIIGRPNVGKSTFFNRVLGERRAVVHDRPGVTRDRNAAHAEWGGRSFLLVDTGGFLPHAGAGMDAVVRRQAETALQNSDVVLFMVDARTGVTDLDVDIARLLRRRGAPSLVVVNKADRPESPVAHEFHRLGLGDPAAVSSEQGFGVGDLLDRLVPLFPPPSQEAEAEAATHVAIIGRPNVGKSSLVNALLGEERMIVHDQPGTTVDAVDSRWDTPRGSFVLVDTAGIRQQPHFREQTEFYSVLRALHALTRAQVAALVVDATQGFQSQDARLAQDAYEAGCALLLIYNKWDLLGEREENWKRLLRERAERYPTLADAPALPVSATSGLHLGKLAGMLAERGRQASRRITTAKLNDWLQGVQRRQSAPSNRVGRAPRIYYMTQTGVRPPEFTLYANRPSLVNASYRRFLFSRFAEHFGFQGCPVRIRVRKSE